MSGITAKVGAKRQNLGSTEERTSLEWSALTGVPGLTTGTCIMAKGLIPADMKLLKEEKGACYFSYQIKNSAKE